jgi:hypothetical protein
MASTFTTLGIEKMATGENAGTWGDKTNTNLDIVNTAVSGYVEQAVTSGGTTTLSITDGAATSTAQNAVIKLTGTISGNSIVTVPDSVEKIYIVTNGTSGAYTVQFKTASGSGITFGLSEKTTKLLYSDGTNIVDAGFSGGTDLDGKELILDADGDTSLTADTDDQIDIKIAGTDQLTIKDGALSPVTTNDIDLGTASLEFKNAFFDGTVTADAFAGPLTGNVTGNASGTAATVTTAAQTNITSLGTLTTLTVDNVITNGATIGHTSDTDLITLADGIVTVAGEISVTTLDIGGTNVTSDATELNLLDGATVVIPGKVEGTNFTDSLLIGHATTGTLNAAERNTGIGIETLDALTSGDRNTAVGYQAGTDLTTGGFNIFLGDSAGKDHTTESNNTGVGYGAMDNAAGSDDSVGIGSTSNRNNKGDFNTAIGSNSLVGSNHSGNNSTNNTAIGYNAGNDVNQAHYNIMLGSGAGSNITSGAANVIIGNVDAASATDDRQLKIAGYDGTNTTTWISGDSAGKVTLAGALQVSGAVTVGVDDTGLDVKLFGASAGAYMEWDESIDTLRIVGASADATTSTGKLLLATSLTNINASDVIGKIDFQAPLEAGGTDAITVAASIQAMAQGTFSASVNATDLIFFTGHSEAATEKFRFTSEGEIGVGGANYGTDGQVLTSGGAGAAPAWEDAAGGLTGKQEGTNFTNSLLVGHSTTGTLNAAEKNTGVGIAALDAVTSADFNTAVGYQAGTALTTGTKNTFIGADTGKGVSTLYQNTGVGYNALSHASFAGHSNTVLGVNAGEGVTSGNKNVFLGWSSGNNITSGSGNVVIGNADVASATGDDQLSISDGEDGSVVWISGDSDGLLTITGGEVIPGKKEGTNFTNSLLVGHATTGTLNAAIQNTGVGIAALDALTSGDNNVAVGHNAGTAITSSGSNTVVGKNSATSLTTGAGGNTALGSTTIYYNSTGVKNTAIGYEALKGASGQSNSYNTAVGGLSNTAITTGEYNITLGYASGDNITSGDGNVIIGGINADSATGDKQLIIADGVDGSVAWIKGDSAGTVSANGGHLTTTGKSLVFGF